MADKPEPKPEKDEDLEIIMGQARGEPSPIKLHDTDPSIPTADPNETKK
jgi:hypothetical protein